MAWTLEPAEADGFTLLQWRSGQRVMQLRETLREDVYVLWVNWNEVLARGTLKRCVARALQEGAPFPGVEHGAGA